MPIPHYQDHAHPSLPSLKPHHKTAATAAAVPLPAWLPPLHLPLLLWPSLPPLPQLLRSSMQLHFHRPSLPSLPLPFLLWPSLPPLWLTLLNVQHIKGRCTTWTPPMQLCSDWMTRREHYINTVSIGKGNPRLHYYSRQCKLKRLLYSQLQVAEQPKYKNWLLFLPAAASRSSLFYWTTLPSESVNVDCTISKWV